jgi:exonuclease III
MRLISLNVNGAGTARILYQVEALVAREPDVIALSEVRIRHFPVYERVFKEGGYPHVYPSVPYGTPPAESFRQLGVLVASKYKAVASPGSPPAPVIPWPERLLSLTLDTPWGEVDLYNAYPLWTYLVKENDIPIGPSTRLPILEGLYAGLAHATRRHRILCGDLNLPKGENPDGTIVTWGFDTWEQDERADAVERAILQGLAEFDLHDVFRHLHGYEKQEFSRYSNAKVPNGFRIDHILASSSLNAMECRYLHHFLEPWGGTGIRLSDHSAIEAVFHPENMTSAR